MINLKTRRLTIVIRRAFVTSLLTPALLAMFSKDPLSLAMTQGALRVMAQLEPTLVMPELLERAYGGLEVVNETHRTTAVLKILSGISLPLVSESLWRPGQKHLLPLLELCIPGIDLVCHILPVSRFIFDVLGHRTTRTRLYARPHSLLVRFSILRSATSLCTGPDLRYLGTYLAKISRNSTMTKLNSLGALR